MSLDEKSGKDEVIPMKDHSLGNGGEMLMVD